MWTRRLACSALLALCVAVLPACEPAAPTLTATVLVQGLTFPWDIAFAPDGRGYFTERGGKINVLKTDGTTAQLQADLTGLWVAGETGLMGIAVDPQFSTTRRIYTCQGHTTAQGHDVRVVPWVVSADGTALTRRPALVTGMPTSSGRHGGCRLRFAPDERLWIGTGDSAQGTVPQNLGSLGGKLLRVDRYTGAGVAGNPFASSSNANTRRIWNYGHRNVQGLACRADGTMWSVEHGTDRDDEINQGVPGNFGWDPVPGYDETTPMTDLTKFPGAQTAAWSSGFPTIATSGATWLAGSQWGSWAGYLAVATLKDKSLHVFRVMPDGTHLEHVAVRFDGTYGRLRTAQLGPGGALYLTTSNGSGTDQIIRVVAG